jgi:hypothetical protein
MMPTYLVQTEDGLLHGYFSADILRIDLAINKEENVKLYSLDQGLTTTYVPMTREQLDEIA